MAKNNEITEHYYTEKPTSKIKEQLITDFLRGKELTFTTASGLFSPKKIDEGTKLLIENAIIQPNWKILDLGCGYGPVGIALKKSFPNTEVTLLDINERALVYSKKNAEQNKVEVNVIKNLSEEKFNTILLNPPQSAGKETCFDLITSSEKYLIRGGLLQMVARHNKGGKVLENKMKELFGNVRSFAKQGGYRIYISEKS
ncbi:class I SAM-dependent methyltransferase [Candidatus Woesearchaeota archaeon]|nr:class I SAM-dependent methyltransferase [Candidatus Woesearchaeota archaeon]